VEESVPTRGVAAGTEAPDQAAAPLRAIDQRQAANENFAQKRVMEMPDLIVVLRIKKCVAGGHIKGLCREYSGLGCVRRF
jgi:hypothetical protein